MARFKADALGKLLDMALAERKGAAAKEKKLLRALNALLGRMGYQVVERDSGAPAKTVRRRRRRTRGRPGRRRARAGKVQAKGRPKRARKPGRPVKARAKRRAPKGKG